MSLVTESSPTEPDSSHDAAHPIAPPASGRRRWPRILALVVVVLAALAASAYLYAPHHRPALRADETYGIDVSHHQGEIDWTLVAEDDIAFAYLKASEGTGFTDSRFTENWAAADEAGVRRGAYHFFTLCLPGAEQAEHFLRTAPPQAGALPPAVDLELVGNCSARPSTDAVVDELDDFLAVVEESWGTDVVLYVGEDWESRYPVLDRSDRPRWLVSFLGRPDVTWTVWQTSWWGRVDGIEGDVDIDVGRLDAMPTSTTGRP